jgi:hypothetical protein
MLCTINDKSYRISYLATKGKSYYHLSFFDMLSCIKAHIFKIAFIQRLDLSMRAKRALAVDFLHEFLVARIAFTGWRALIVFVFVKAAVTALAAVFCHVGRDIGARLLRLAGRCSRLFRRYLSGWLFADYLAGKISFYQVLKVV